MTTAYHPQANGMIERAHRQIKDALRAREAGVAWPDHLPWVLLGIRTAPKEDSALSSAELLYGTPLTLPGQFLDSSEPPPLHFVENLRRASPPPPTRPLTYAEVTRELPEALQTCSYVYIRKGGTVPALQPLYMGPYSVIRRSEKFFVINIGGKHDSVSVDRLKPHLGLSPVEPATPPLRGRPPIFMQPPPLRS
jgi:hypothetical protein